MTKKVLIAEDNRDVREMMAVFVGMQGYRVILAHNGKHAIDQAGDHCPDLILMDIGLPDIDGLQATRIIRATAHCTNIPIIAVTAYRGLREKALEAGCDDLLEKPLDLGSLVYVLEGHLGGK